jgi:hypothetical protein
MAKGFIKYFLSACIFLLSAHNFVYGYTNQTYTHISLLKTLQSSANSGFSAQQNTPTLTIKSVSSGKEKEGDDEVLVAYDDDDDELVSFKKNLEIGNCSTSFQMPEDFFNHNKNILLFYKCFSYPASYRHIIFQVFKI